MATTSETTMATGRRQTGVNRLAMARSRGAVVGPLLMLLGIWGALIPFVGHSFGYGFTPDVNWQWTAARGWLEVAPGAATFVGGLLFSGTAHRVSAMIGAWLAIAAGAWYVLGVIASPLWSAGFIGHPDGTSATHVFLEQVGMFFGLGVVIVLLAASAVGRFSLAGLREAPVARRQIDLTSAEPATSTTAAADPGTRRAI
jgi:hypothetical protein